MNYYDSDGDMCLNTKKPKTMTILSSSDESSDEEAGSSDEDAGSSDQFEDAESSDEDAGSSEEDAGINDQVEDHRDEFQESSDEDGEYNESEKENKNNSNSSWTAVGREREPFEFLSNPGKHFNIPSCYKTVPLFYMEKFLDNDLMKIIVDQTNSYAAKFLESCPQLKRNSRLKKWFPTTVNEMRCFIALLVLQGIVKKPTIQMYFSKRETISTPFFRKVMNVNRFILLCKFIHFEDNERSDCLKPVNKLAKIQTVFENIKEKCKNLYIPEQDICVDESLLLWKGRLSWKQYIPSKRSRFGMKFFVLCESDSGYIWNFLLYTGKDTKYGPHYSEYMTSSRIVLELTHELLDLGYRIHVDNWYTNINLAEKLCAHQTDLVGTMRKNKVGIPSEIKNSSLKKGEHIERYKNKLMIMKWRDKKDILMLSTIHDGSMIEIEKNNKIKRKPSVVYDYNKKMGGVDNSDGIIVAYSMARKRLKKYYKKIFLHLLDIICMNSYLIYKKCNGKLKRIDFLLEYIEKTIELYSDNSSNTSQLGRPASTTPLRLLGKHFPDLVPSTKAKSNPTRRCSYCSKNNIRRESRYWCPTCKVALCAAPCFKKFHCP